MQMAISVEGLANDDYLPRTYALALIATCLNRLTQRGRHDISSQYSLLELVSILISTESSRGTIKEDNIKCFLRWEPFVGSSLILLEKGKLWTFRCATTNSGYCR